jgi:prepilin-type N-terminal cleavage/methylation domain-containing protein
MRVLRTLRSHDGFTLIEVMVTMLILVIGIAGAIALVDGANARTLTNKQREAANALTREVIEAARSVAYRHLNPTSMVAEIQAIPGLADSTPFTAGWTVERRNERYTVAATICSIDDEQDGFGDITGGNYCSGGGGVTDRNPDDYKRITVNVTWEHGGVTRNVKHAGIVNNESSSAGPGVEFTDQRPPGGLAVYDINDPPPGGTIEFDVEAESTAVAIRFAVDGGVSETVTNQTTATFDWEVDAGGEHIPDGTYVISVTAFDAEGTPGPTKSRTLRLNRQEPAAPQDVFGGWNSRTGFAVKDIVELQWARNTEPDVTGYRVYRASTNTIVPGCDFTTTPTATECRDLDPPAGATIGYYVVALDEDPFDGSPREGAHSALLTATRATTQPNQPPTLTATVDGEAVVLTWGASPAADPTYPGSTVSFYRVYRNGTSLGQRIARTGQDSLLSYRDPDGAGDGHQYWVSAVDENFAESPPLGPVVEP